MQIVFVKPKPTKLVGEGIVKVINVELRDAVAHLTLGNKLRPPFGLRSQRSEVETTTEVEIATPMGYLWLADNGV